MATRAPRRRHIGVDIDGVLADYVGAFCDLCLVHTGKRIPRIATTWDWHRQEGGITAAQDEAISLYIKENPMFWHSLEALPEAQEALSKLDTLAADHSIYFITKRPANAKFWTEMWLSTKGVDNPTVLVVTRDGLKGKLAAALDIDLFLDDKADNCLDVYRSLPPGASVYLYSQPWNTAAQEDWREEKGVKVVRSWTEVFEREGL